MRWLALMAAMLFAASAGKTAEPEPLPLESKIMLGDVKGRIDHFAADPRHQRLFIAELGNSLVAPTSQRWRKRLAAAFAKRNLSIAYVFRPAATGADVNVQPPSLSAVKDAWTALELWAAGELARAIDL